MGARLDQIRVRVGWKMRARTLSLPKRCAVRVRVRVGARLEQLRFTVGARLDQIRVRVGQKMRARRRGEGA